MSFLPSSMEKECFPVVVGSNIFPIEKTKKQCLCSALLAPTIIEKCRLIRKRNNSDSLPKFSHKKQTFNFNRCRAQVGGGGDRGTRRFIPKVRAELLLLHGTSTFNKKQ